MCFTFKTASVRSEQLEQLTEKYSNVTAVHMDVTKHEEKLSSLVKKHDLVIRSEFCVKLDRLNPNPCCFFLLVHCLNQHGNVFFF